MPSGSPYEAGASEKENALFASLGDPAVIRRATYFSELHGGMRSLLWNPFEPLALSLEPSHPWPPSAIQGVFATLGFDDETASLLHTAGLTVVSPELLVYYNAGFDLIRDVVRPKPDGAPAYVLDPAYGTVVWTEEGRFRNRAIVDSLRLRPRPSLPRRIQLRMAEYPADALSEGLILAHTIFGDVVQEQVPGAYDSSDVPEIEVRDAAELAALIGRLQERCTLANVRLWYRGQTSDYPIPDRRGLIAAGVVPYSIHGESSLVPAVYRRIDAFLERVEDFARLVRYVLDWNFEAERLLGPSFTIKGPVAPSGDAGHPMFTGWESSWAAANRRGGESVPILTKEWSPELRQVQTALLLQHYGCPTASIDVTWDPNVAVWFALNRCRDDQGRLRFEPATTARDRRPERRTIFVFPLLEDAHPILDTSKLLRGQRALRPIRQRCGLLCGAGNIARNYAARFLALKIRLHQDFGPPPHFTDRELFPGPDEDDVLRDLLESETLSKNEFPVSRLAAS